MEKLAIFEQAKLEIQAVSLYDTLHMRVKSRSEQSQETREALLSAARELFAERGYAATSTEDVVQRAGLTRGALYHQFRDKEDLFRAVYAEVEREFAEKIGAHMRERIGGGGN